MLIYLLRFQNEHVVLEEDRIINFTFFFFLHDELISKFLCFNLAVACKLKTKLYA